ncbi:MAG: ABC transporter ATP-binding protein [Flavobacteriales bacterium]|nr:ABC transporter ATP-binding protein [Flavobacteriales bacterium]
MISVEHLSKRYVLRHQQAARYTALRDVLASKAKGLFTARQGSPSREEFMALNDVSFTVSQGDRVGIIGRNGAGKSTLLKVLSRIVEPTSGRVVLNGRVASLLEVGTGFHPELSGRENIYLNGAILGMGRREIDRKFDEIVAFSEVEKFLDTPVKRYSSGMYVRLAFAVAAHLEPEILIVDEVLAVGDAQFQKKCLGKMQDVSGEGRTVLFVSHNMESVQRLCNKGLLLHKGRSIAEGGIADVIAQYQASGSPAEARFDLPIPAGDKIAYATSLSVEDADGKPLPEIPIGSPWQVRIAFQLMRPLDGFVIALGITSLLEMPIRTSWSLPCALTPGSYEAVFKNDGIHLAEGRYKLVVGLSVQGQVLQYLPDSAWLTISDVSDLVDDVRIVNTRSGLLINQMGSHIEKRS